MQSSPKKFDPLESSKAMEKAGIDRAAADAITQAIVDSHSDLATKDDIALVRSEIAALGEKMLARFSHQTELTDAKFATVDAKIDGLSRTMKIALAIIIPIITGNFLAVVAILMRPFVGN